MNRLRSILLSGLVALLMLGMVAADEVGTLSGDAAYTLPIGGHIGTWYEGVCINTQDEICVKVWISLDLSWIKSLLF